MSTQNNLDREGKYIRFKWFMASKSGKTHIWEVLAKDGGVKLGEVSWYGAWRCYAFFVSSKWGDFELVFEKQCLRDIANFCEEMTGIQRSLRK
ncbi:MAG: hypothetical protein ACQCN6_01830 [Candidatus Bathyarchaeia archaeon]|jgi:hypothetical protein